MAQQSPLSRLFGHRITLNLLFWIFYFVYPFLRFRYTQEHSITLEEVIFYLLFYGMILYANNLYLLPKYLANKKYREYAAVMIIILLAAAFIESYVNKTLLKTCECEGPNSTYVIYNFIHLGTIMTVFGAVYIFRSYVQNVRDFEKVEKSRLETELKFLKSQVNPHLLFNSLNSIYSYALRHSDEVPDMVLKLAELLRYMLYECDKPYVGLQKEIDYIQDYIDLQQMRVEDADIDFRATGNFNQIQIAPMMLISFVENAFKYGLQAERPKIKIEIKLDEGKLEFNCRNNYIKDLSLERDSPAQNSGLGIKNSVQILELTYKDNYQLEIDDLDQEFSVFLSVKLT